MVKLKTIKAFTILESMVAMVIVMIVFSLASIVVINVSSSGVTRQKHIAHVMIRNLRNETIQEKRFIDEAFELDNLRVEKTLLDYPGSEQLKVLLIEVLKEDKKIMENKELIIVNE